MRKVDVVDPGDTKFLEVNVNKSDFNDRRLDLCKKVVEDPGDSPGMKPGQIITARAA